MQKSQLAIAWYRFCLCQSKWEAGFGSFPMQDKLSSTKANHLIQCYIVVGTAECDNWERRTWWERSFCGTVGESKAQDGKEDFSTARVGSAFLLLVQKKLCTVLN